MKKIIFLLFCSVISLQIAAQEKFPKEALKVIEHLLGEKPILNEEAIKELDPNKLFPAFKKEENGFSVIITEDASPDLFYYTELSKAYRFVQFLERYEKINDDDFFIWQAEIEIFNSSKFSKEDLILAHKYMSAISKRIQDTMRENAN